LSASGYAGHEQGGGRPIDGARPTASTLVQRAIDQPTARKPLVDLRHAERQNASLALTGAFEVRDLFAQAVEDGVWSGG
jgi:hypothetical protein